MAQAVECQWEHPSLDPFQPVETLHNNTAVFLLKEKRLITVNINKVVLTQNEQALQLFFMIFVCCSAIGVVCTDAASC